MAKSTKISIGQTFGRLKIEECLGSRVYGSSRQKFWRCACVCGNSVEVNTTRLIHGQKSCGCLRLETVSKRRTDPQASAKRNVLSMYKRCAKSRNLVWTLTDQEALLLMSQNCFYCGVTPSNISRDSYDRLWDFIYNGIDRLDNSLGYIRTNCVTCCLICNRAKSDMTVKQFFDWARTIVYGKIK